MRWTDCPGVFLVCFFKYMISNYALGLFYEYKYTFSSSVLSLFYKTNTHFPALHKGVRALYWANTTKHGQCPQLQHFFSGMGFGKFSFWAFKTWKSTLWSGKCSFWAWKMWNSTYCVAETAKLRPRLKHHPPCQSQLFASAAVSLA